MFLESFLIFYEMKASGIVPTISIQINFQKDFIDKLFTMKLFYIHFNLINNKLNQIF
jgi:hypothetical protein